MIHIQLTLINGKDFWEKLTGTAYWQVILLLLTAFLTAYFTHMFIGRRNDHNRRMEAISDFRRYGYELQQVVSNRFQCEIFTNFYDVLYKLTGNQDYLDHQKIEIAKMPDLSLEVSKAYGRIYKTASLFDQLIDKRKMSSIDSELNKVINHKMPSIGLPSSAMTEKEIVAYKDEMTASLAVWIDEHIKQHVNKVYSFLK